MIVAARVVMALPAAAADGTPAPGPAPYLRLTATWWEWALEAPTPDDTSGSLADRPRGHQ